MGIDEDVVGVVGGRARSGDARTGTPGGRWYAQRNDGIIRVGHSLHPPADSCPSDTAVLMFEHAMWGAPPRQGLRALRSKGGGHQALDPNTSQVRCQRRKPNSRQGVKLLDAAMQVYEVKHTGRLEEAYA